MHCSSLSFSLIDYLWLFLALCFLAAFCVHKLTVCGLKSGQTSVLFTLFQDLIRFGKTKQILKRSDWLRVLDVPKRWFWHFYLVSVCWNSFLLVLNLSSTCPPWLNKTIKVLTGVPRPASKDPHLSSVLVQLLLCVHSLRRLLECCCVSVFSDGVLHVGQYVFGLAYYVVLGLTVLCTDHTAEGPGPLLSQLDWIQGAGLVLFVGASLLQHQSMVLLARLRTGNTGRVETFAHRMPEGGCFQLVSCPHYFAELLIYVSFSLVFGGLSVTWWLVVLYVLFNQALAGQLSHELYISRYKSYPKCRRAFIPYVF